MQPTTFWIIISTLCAAGIVLCIAGIIFLIVNHVKGRLRERRSLKTTGVVLIIVGILAIAVPACMIANIRAENGARTSAYVDTGRLLSWEKGKTFIYEGEKYVPLSIYYGRFGMEVNSEAFEETPEFNIKNKDNIWAILFNAYEYDTVYKLKNDSGYNIYYCENGVYCPQDNLDDVVRYYCDEANATWSLTMMKNYTEVDRKISLSDKELKEIKEFRIRNSDTILKTAYVEENGSRTLCRQSRDRLFRVTLQLTYQKGRWYWNTEWEVDNSPGDTYGIKLSRSLNDKIAGIH